MNVKEDHDRLPRLASRAAYIKQAMLRDELTEHRNYTRKAGEDMPQILSRRWLALLAAARMVQFSGRMAQDSARGGSIMSRRPTCT